MTCSQSLLYSFGCRFLNSPNSLLESFVFLFSSSTSSTRAVVLSCSLASYSRSVIFVDVSPLVLLLRIPSFLKKSFSCLLGRGLALGETEDLGNNISTSHWLLPINNRFYLHSFLRNSISKILGYR